VRARQNFSVQREKESDDEFIWYWRGEIQGRTLGFGIWDLGFGIRDLGFGIWDLGFGIWDLGFGICPLR
jgi:hypothetical protein